MSNDHTAIDETPGTFVRPPEDWAPSHVTADIEAQLRVAVRERIEETASTHRITDRQAAEIVLDEIRHAASMRSNPATTLDAAILREVREVRSQLAIAMQWGGEALVGWDMEKSVAALWRRRAIRRDIDVRYEQAVRAQLNATIEALQRARDALTDEISEAKERLAKLTKADAVHTLSLAEHIAKIEAWKDVQVIEIGGVAFLRVDHGEYTVTPKRCEIAREPAIAEVEHDAADALLRWMDIPGEIEARWLRGAGARVRTVRIATDIAAGRITCPRAPYAGLIDVPCEYCGKSHGPLSRAKPSTTERMVGADRTSVVVEEDDGDPT